VLRERAVDESALRGHISSHAEGQPREGEPRAARNGNRVAVLATVIDVDGRAVELTEERWAHIVGAEPPGAPATPSSHSSMRSFARSRRPVIASPVAATARNGSTAKAPVQAAS
jgi:hypothetical protein